MGFFSRWKTKRLLDKARKHAENSRLADLSNAIFETAVARANTIEPYLADIADGKRQEVRLYCTFEFIYFFVHLTNRLALPMLGPQGRTRPMDELQPLLVFPAIEALFGDWPQDLKDKLAADFVDKLQSSETEYARCRPITDSDFTAESNLFYTLARIVSDIAGKPDEVSLRSAIVADALQGVQDVQWVALVKEAAMEAGVRR